jgi:two-component system, chemotaxis family, protein-glutamate methylesterase/glutaminase
MSDIIVIGASAGGVAAVSELVKGLPADLDAAIFVVVHVPGHSKSMLAKILSRKGELPAISPVDGERIEHGRIYVAPPDRHMLIKQGYVRLVHGPRENGSRPAIDPLFRTAARVYGKRVVGVVLSGTLDDGTAGLIAVKKRGGIVIVQDPEEATYSGMPNSAIEHNTVDYVLPVSEIASTLVMLAARPISNEGGEPVDEEMEQEADIAELDVSALHSTEKPGFPSRFSCPECQGVLWEIDDDMMYRFRCRVGHAYSPETLMSKQSDAVEVALWAGLRALEENASLMQRISKRMLEMGNTASAARFSDQAIGALQRADTLRQLILQREPLTAVEPEPSPVSAE